MARQTERVELRLDRERREKLKFVVERRKESLSEWLRREIDQAYEEELTREREAAAAELSALEIEEMPDMRTLKRQVEGNYGVDLR